MADYTSKVSTNTVRRTTFRIALPTNLIEVAKMSSGAQAEWRKQHPEATFYDDSIEVEADDEALTFRWDDEVTA